MSGIVFRGLAGFGIGVFLRETLGMEHALWAIACGAVGIAYGIWIAGCSLVEGHEGACKS